MSFTDNEDTAVILSRLVRIADTADNSVVIVVLTMARWQLCRAGSYNNSGAVTVTTLFVDHNSFIHDDTARLEVSTGKTSARPHDDMIRLRAKIGLESDMRWQCSTGRDMISVFNCYESCYLSLEESLTRVYIIRMTANGTLTMIIKNNIICNLCCC